LRQVEVEESKTRGIEPPKNTFEYAQTKDCSNFLNRIIFDTFLAIFISFLIRRRLKMDRLVINPETGEILTVLVDGDRIIRSRSIDALSELENAPKNETFTKLYHKIVPLMVECDLSASELMIFMHLAVNLRYLSNVAKYPNGKLINRNNLQSDLHLSEPTIKRAIYRLVKFGLIVEALTLEGKVFIVNPYVVAVGDKINKTVYDLFRKSKWARW
jgi:hypothetical protein